MTQNLHIVKSDTNISARREVLEKSMAIVAKFMAVITTTNTTNFTRIEYFRTFEYIVASRHFSNWLSTWANRTKIKFTLISNSKTFGKHVPIKKNWLQFYLYVSTIEYTAGKITKSHKTSEPILECSMQFSYSVFSTK